MFQSFAGSQTANEAFGISVALMDEAWATMKERGTGKGKNCMYFETGQGSALSSDAHHGADQLTLEARCYGFARRYKPFLVNTVVGFIGPEYLEDGAQITRAALEDHFMGKLLGLPTGCDACYTYHSRMGQDELENLKVLLGTAGCSYLMSLPVGDDIMLNYQSTSFHDVATVRALVRKRPTPEFDAWLNEKGIMDGDRPGKRFGDPTVIEIGGHRSTPEGIAASAARHTPARLGVGHVGSRYPTNVSLQFQTDLAVAHDAVSTELPDDWATTHGYLPLRSRVRDGREFLLRPDLGRRLDAASVAHLRAEPGAAWTYSPSLPTDCQRWRAWAPGPSFLPGTSPPARPVAGPLERRCAQNSPACGWRTKLARRSGHA